MRRALAIVALLGALPMAGSALSGCVQAHCTNARYDEAECRVIAENEYARLRSSRGVEIRFQKPDASEAGTWDARGLLAELSDGTVEARVAGPGRFALSVRAPDDVDVADLRARIKLSGT